MKLIVFMTKRKKKENLKRVTKGPIPTASAYEPNINSINGQPLGSRTERVSMLKVLQIEFDMTSREGARQQPV